MEKELFDFVAERAGILSASENSKQETKEAALAWKSAVEGADDEVIEAATDKLVDFLEGRPNTVEGVIAFAQGPAVGMFGKEVADQILAEQLERKEQGEKYCNCDACTAAGAAREVRPDLGRAVLRDGNPRASAIATREGCPCPSAESALSLGRWTDDLPLGLADGRHGRSSGGTAWGLPARGPSSGKSGKGPLAPAGQERESPACASRGLHTRTLSFFAMRNLPRGAVRLLGLGH